MSTQTKTNTRIGVHYSDLSIGLYILDCANCGLVFAINTDFEDRRREDGKAFYCPNGHVQSWSETEADRERKKAERLERQIANERESARALWADLKIEKVKHAATKGKLTKTRKRAINGVCPCCQRSFANVQRHVASQHPEQVSS
jgi:hypothetical protein